MPPEINIEVARATVLEHILAERERQDRKWGDQIENSDPLWAVIALEEFGEVSREVYEKELGKAYIELIQLSAVCVAWAEALRRRGILNEK
tara:strand:+ start:290 stop:562 length:273 start_codon:yes stop_codon:yes gene_type:complete